MMEAQPIDASPVLDIGVLGRLSITIDKPDAFSHKREEYRCHHDHVGGRSQIVRL